MKYILTRGTVQPVVYKMSEDGDTDTTFFMYHFGRAEYDRTKPIISESIRKQAQPIIDKLNSGELDEKEAINLLDRIYF